MTELNNKKLLVIIGGANFTGSLVSALTKGINTILDLGKTLGSAVRRIVNGQICSF